MSASLVGSEMCIRDRPPRPPPHEASSSHAPDGFGGWGSGERGGSPPGEEAVSYTHLTLPTICSV
eukprot:15117443-Alexandrium_andersonii.AAC.1